MPSKGIREVIEAVRLLTEEDRMNRNKLLLEVVGEYSDEKLRDEMMRKVEENKLPVGFHPWVDKEKKLEFLSKADIFVFPPCKPEGHPWVIVEAMAAGLPIISTDQGAIVESVIHGENGFIVESKNSRQIAEKIKFLIENPDIREKMSAESRKKYLENFTEEKMVERLQTVFAEVMDKR
jgi:glycosyltransferase involved in cell wall biosynthesis